jgi:hypothetical protein
MTYVFTFADIALQTKEAAILHLPGTSSVREGREQ